LYGCLNNNVKQLALASLRVNFEIVAALGADDDLERVGDRDVGPAVPVGKPDLGTGEWELEVITERPGTWAHEVRGYLGELLVCGVVVLNC